MNFTQIQKLKDLLEELTNRDFSNRQRLQTGEKLQRYFPTDCSTNIYAQVIQEEDISEEVRWAAILMIYYAGNDDSVSGFIAFLECPKMSGMLKLNVATLLVSLNPQYEEFALRHLPKMPLPWRPKGVESFPGATEKERREYLAKQLLINLFVEGTE